MGWYEDDVARYTKELPAAMTWQEKYERLRVAVEEETGEDGNPFEDLPPFLEALESVTVESE